MRAPNIDDEELQLVYQWVDGIPLSKHKKNITRDFSDGGSNIGLMMYSIYG